MTDLTDDEIVAAHDRHVVIVRDAVVSLVQRFGPSGLGPLAVLEGAVKGAVIALIAARMATIGEAADLLEEMADQCRRASTEQGAAPHQ